MVDYDFIGGRTEGSGGGGGGGGGGPGGKVDISTLILLLHLCICTNYLNLISLVFCLLAIITATIIHKLVSSY